MKELIEVIAKSLVDHPSEVVVTETVSGDDLLLELKVDPSDMGKVIGRQGRIAKAVLARDLGDCRDNLRNSQSVFLKSQYTVELVGKGF